MKDQFGKPENILIVRLGAMGDVVYVIPALKNLRTKFHSAHIAWLVEDKLSGLIELLPDVDDIVIFPRKQWQEDLKNPLKYFSLIRKIWTFIKKLRNKKYDIVLDFHGNLKSGILTFLSKAETRIGFAKGFCKEFNYIFTDLRITPSHKQMHRVEKYFSLLHPLGIEAHYQKPSFSIPMTDQIYIREFIQKHNIKDEILAIIHPGTSTFGKYKRWPLENYARLADLLIQELGCKVILTWGAMEYEMVKKISNLMHYRAIITCKTSTIGKLIALLQHSWLYIGGDTGPTHIASSLGIPTIAIFGPKDPVMYAPYGENSRVIRKEIDCSPCTKRTCDHITCIRLVTVEDVFNAATRLIEEKKFDFFPVP